MKKVLIVYCEKKANIPRIPLASVAIASYARKKGYNPEILDLRLDNYDNINFKDYIAVGLGTLTGPGIKYGRILAKEAKRQNPEIVIAWGGPHVSLFLEQSLKDKYVDVIVREEGDASFVELLDTISKNKPLDIVRGISFKKDGKIIHNPSVPLMELDELDYPAYDLLKGIERYADLKEEFGYESSRGCPHRCQFCYCLDFHKQKWRAKSAEHVLRDIDRIVKDYNPRKIFLPDDNFFVNKKRVMDICKGIIERKYKVKWGACARMDYISRYTDEELKTLKDGGCWYLGLGAESGSVKGLNILKKDITKEQSILATKKLVRHGILPQISFVIGFPGETKKDMMETLNLYDRLMDVHHTVEVNGVFIFYPIPGTPMYDQAIKLGYDTKETFKDWAEWRSNNPANTPWWDAKYKKQLFTISRIVRFKYFMHRLKYSYSKEFLKNKLRTPQNRILFAIFMPLYKLSANIRWKTRFFSYGYEWNLFNYVTKKKFEIY
ncbi:MAG: radical SAM protein [archaeon]